MNLQLSLKKKWFEMTKKFAQPKKIVIFGGIMGMLNIHLKIDNAEL